MPTQSSATTDHTSMNIDRIKKAHASAIEAFKQIGGDGPSLDALFVAAYVCAEAPHAIAQRKTTETPPAWFAEGVKKMGECVATASTVMRIIRVAEPTPADSRQCGMWLRAMGCAAFKSNGQTKFRLGDNSAALLP